MNRRRPSESSQIVGGSRSTRGETAGGVASVSAQGIALTAYEEMQLTLARRGIQPSRLVWRNLEFSEREPGVAVRQSRVRHDGNYRHVFHHGSRRRRRRVTASKHQDVDAIAGVYRRYPDRCIVESDLIPHVSRRDPFDASRRSANRGESGREQDIATMHHR